MEVMLVKRALFLTLFLTSNPITIEGLASGIFEAVISSVGENLCAINEPNDVALNVRSVIKCGAICIADAFCVTYSFKSAVNECDLFGYTAPQSYAVVPGCRSYKLRGIILFKLLKQYR